jgi:hypothetical protein
MLSSRPRQAWGLAVLESVETRAAPAGINRRIFQAETYARLPVMIADVRADRHEGCIRLRPSLRLGNRRPPGNLTDVRRVKRRARWAVDVAVGQAVRQNDPSWMPFLPALSPWRELCLDQRPLTFSSASLSGAQKSLPETSSSARIG